MLNRQETLCLLASDLVHCVDEENLVPAFFWLDRTTENNTRFHWRVVKEVGSESEDRLDDVGFDHFGTHVLLFIAKQHSVREEDRAATGLRIHRRQDVLPEGVVGSSLRWSAKEIASPLVRLPSSSIPRLDGIRRVGEYHVEGPQPITGGERRVRQRVTSDNVKVFDAVQKEVHASDGRRCQVQFLSVELEGSVLLALAANLF